MESIDWRINGQGFTCPFSKDWENVHRAQKLLASSRDGVVEISCFNRADVEDYKMRFTPDELKRIRFKWLEFSDRRPPNDPLT